MLLNEIGSTVYASDKIYNFLKGSNILLKNRDLIIYNIAEHKNFRYVGNYQNLDVSYTYDLISSCRKIRLKFHHSELTDFGLGEEYKIKRVLLFEKTIC
jgi:hypothetical protein